MRRPHYLAVVMVLLVALVGVTKWSAYREANPTLQMVATATTAEKLAHYATAAPDARVRSAAVERIDDPELLHQILISDHDHKVKWAAVARINDPAVVIRVLSEADLHTKALRQRVFANLSGADHLQAVALRNDVHQASEWAASRLSDADFVEVAIAKAEACWEPQQIRKLKDQSAIERLVLAPVHQSTRQTALRRLRNVDLLQQLALGEKTLPGTDERVHHEYAELALYGLYSRVDEATLANIVEHSRYPTVAAKAISGVRDVDTLRRLTKSSPSGHVAKAALLALERVDRSAARTLRDELLLTTTHGDLASYLVNQTNDDSLLKRVVMTAENRSTRYYALMKIDDPEFNLEVARTHPDPTTRYRAIERVTDPHQLAQLAIHERDRNTALSACRRVESIPP